MIRIFLKTSYLSLEIPEPSSEISETLDEVSVSTTFVQSRLVSVSTTTEIPSLDESRSRQPQNLIVSLFLSSILNNAEVMYNLSKSEIEEFDQLDLVLMRKIMNAPLSTPKEAFFLELNVIPPSTIIKIKRATYLRSQSRH